MEAGETALRAYALAELAYLPVGVAFFALPHGRFLCLTPTTEAMVQ